MLSDDIMLQGVNRNKNTIGKLGFSDIRFKGVPLGLTSMMEARSIG
jgi:hypothetical protein